MPDLPQTFGPYTLQELIARGGMAEIYRASMPGIEGFEKTVAIKKILPHLAEDDEFIDMLVDEAQIIEKLDHANIAQVFDLGKIDGSYYIAMEYIHGVDLDAIIDELAEHDALLPYEHTAHILANICDGLHFAHNKTDENGDPLDVIHRDVSPHNVMLSFAGDVKIIDFGVAKAADQQDKAESDSVKGKLLYMAPEQAKSDEQLDGRADLFAVGLCAYKMLTDTLPFRGDNEFEVYDNVINADIPPPRQLQPDVPKRLNDIVMKLLQRDPDARYQSGYDAQQDFERALHDIAPGYTVTRLSNFVEQNFSHLLRKQQSAPTSAPDNIPESTPAPSQPHTGERNLADFPAKADTSGASAQQKARNTADPADASDSSPHREPVAESIPDDDLHEGETRAVSPDQLTPDSTSAPSAPSPDAAPADTEPPPGTSPSSTSKQAPDASARPQTPSPESDSDAGDDAPSAILTANRLLLIGIALVSAGILGTGGYLYFDLFNSTDTTDSTANVTGQDSPQQPTGASSPDDEQTGDQHDGNTTEQSDKPSPDDESNESPPADKPNTDRPTLSIETVPSGARILRDGTELGTTPHELAVDDAGDEPLELTLAKDGFAERTVRILPIDGAQKTFDLSDQSDSAQPDSGPATASNSANDTPDDGESTSPDPETSSVTADDNSPPAEDSPDNNDAAAESAGEQSPSDAPKQKSTDSNTTETESAAEGTGSENKDSEKTDDSEQIIDPFAD